MSPSMKSITRLFSAVKPPRRFKPLWPCCGVLSFFSIVLLIQGQVAPQDTGVRGGPANAGGAIVGLSASQSSFFTMGQEAFAEVDSVQGSSVVPGTRLGLGPKFNAEGCAQCHAQPAAGGSSPAVNPQVAVATDQGAANHVPSFITINGPIREARFPYAVNSHHRRPDGGVHALFTISGRIDASGCSIAQDNFDQAAKDSNLIFRIPTPTFGGGLIEVLQDYDLIANLSSSPYLKRSLGISGRFNTGADGTITRFGWKAQNKSLEIFAGEAYNVEQGVTNELFPTERAEIPGCMYNGRPEDATNTDETSMELASDVVRFAAFMRFLDQPKPAAPTSSTQNGRAVFSSIGCNLCHSPSLLTRTSSIAALSNVQVNLFSDLALHHMGPGLADNINQGVAQGDEFRTAPLWGLGQRIFFLHDGRTSDLVQAIQAHASSGNQQYQSSEANTVVGKYNALSAQNQQDLLNFLRSL